jgi:hypothetical protein
LNNEPALLRHEMNADETTIPFNGLRKYGDYDRLETNTVLEQTP